MSGGPSMTTAWPLPVVPTKFQFAQHGESGAWLSEALLHTAEVVDDICLVKSIHSEAINHDPARMLIQTGAQLGMQTMDQNLQDLVKRNIISVDEARSKAANKDAFK